MLSKLVNFTLRGEYNKFKRLFEGSDINLENSIEITLLDLFEDKNVKQIVLLRIMKDESITPDNRIELIKKLINSKVDVNHRDIKERNTFLHYSRDKTVTKFLIDMKANVNQENYRRQTPLNFAVFENCYDIAKILIENKANINVKIKYGKTPLHHCKDKNIAKLLIENRAHIEARDKYGFTPLHVCKDKDVAKLLIECKANLGALDKHGNTPLHTCRNKDVVKVLIECKAVINANNKYGGTPLHYCGDIEFIKILVKAKADVNARNKFGKTRLHYYGNIELVKVLIKAKADINIKNNRGETFLDIYRGYKNKEILQILIDEQVPFKITDKIQEIITPEFFKKHTKYTIKCILNYDRNKVIQNVINFMINCAN